MPAIKFTQSSIKAANLRPAAGKKAVYFDSEKPGLGMRVTHNDKRTFFHVSYLPGNRQSRNNLGAATATRIKPGEQVLSLKEARNMVDAVNVATRHAPVQETSTNRTMESLVKEWVEEHAAGLASESDVRRYADEVIATIGSKPVEDVTQKDVYDMVKAKAVKAPRAAMLVLHYCKAALDHGANTGLIKFNPAASLTPKKILVRDENGDRQKLRINHRQRYLSPDEIKGLWANETLDPTIKLALQTILLTGQRPGEVIGMHESEIEDRIWTVPAQRRGKTNESNRVWLSDMAMGLLEEAAWETRSRDGHLFKSTMGKAATNDVRLFAKAVKRERVALHNSDVSTLNDEVDYNPRGEHWTPHDLRRTTRTGFTDLGFSREDSERVLGHKLPGVEGTYDRSAFLAQQERMFSKWQDRLQGWVN